MSSIRIRLDWLAVSVINLPLTQQIAQRISLGRLTQEQEPLGVHQR